MLKFGTGFQVTCTQIDVTKSARGCHSSLIFVLGMKNEEEYPASKWPQDRQGHSAATLAARL